MITKPYVTLIWKILKPVGLISISILPVLTMTAGGMNFNQSQGGSELESFIICPWKRGFYSGIWDEIPAAFLPTTCKILELCFIVIQHPTDDMIQQISLLSWVIHLEK